MTSTPRKINQLLDIDSDQKIQFEQFSCIPIHQISFHNLLLPIINSFTSKARSALPIAFTIFSKGVRF